MANKTLYHYTVEPQGVDFTLHATQENLGQILLNTAGEDAHLKGFGADALMPKGMLWVLSRMTMEIKSRPEQYSDFDVATWVSSNNRIISTRCFEMRNTAGQIFLNSVTLWCLIDTSKRCPLSLGESIPSIEDYVCQDPEPCSSPRRLRETEYDVVREHGVRYSDIDFNCHVNSMRYITLMTDLLPLEFHSANSPMRIDINFLHEATYGQMLEIGYAQKSGSHLFRIKNLDDGTTSVLAEIQGL